MKTVLITGASSGIGAEIARQFDKPNHHLLLFGRDQEKLKSVSSEIREASTETFSCDLSQKSEVLQAFKDLAKTTSSIDILVNNAGLIQQNRFEDSKEEEWEYQFQANLFGSFRITQNSLSLLRKGEGKSIVNIASNLGFRPISNTSVYSATKAAMINWTKSLALELASENIRVNVICPGIVNTPIHSFYNKEDSESTNTRDACRKVSPLGKIGDPKDIAEAVEFLASSKWITGNTLEIDGGSTL